MIPVLLLAVVGGFLAYQNWDEMVKWLQDFLPKINAALDGVVKYSAKLFSSVEGGVLRLVHKLYYRENGKWIEKTTTREIDESQVPEWAKADLGEEETDVTDRYQKELELKV